MGRTSFGDIPGNVNVLWASVASYASNAATATTIVHRVPYNAKVVGFHICPVTSAASAASKDVGLKLVNLGTAGTGTTVLGSLLGTVAYASWVPLAMTLAATPTVSAGDVIGLTWASTTSTTVSPAGVGSLHLTYI